MTSADKDEYLPTLYELGLERYTTTRIWNKSDKHQLGHIFEYRDKDNGSMFAHLEQIRGTVER